MNCLPNVHFTKNGQHWLKNIPTSLGTSNISLEKGNQVLGGASTVLRSIGGSPCCLEKDMQRGRRLGLLLNHPSRSDGSVFSLSLDFINLGEWEDAPLWCVI